MKKLYTDKQGQYLAFIYYYGKIHGCPPSESEMQQYFQVSPPSVHQMTFTLETHGLIDRTPGHARIWCFAVLCLRPPRHTEHDNPEWTALTSGMGHFSVQMVTLDQVR